jgi:hypothetical protein
MTWWVWASDPDDAIEVLFACCEYKTREEAMQHVKRERKLFKVNVEETELHDKE